MSKLLILALILLSSCSTAIRLKSLEAITDTSFSTRAVVPSVPQSAFVLMGPPGIPFIPRWQMWSFEYITLKVLDPQTPCPAMGLASGKFESKRDDSVLCLYKFDPDTLSTYSILWQNGQQDSLRYKQAVGWKYKPIDLEYMKGVQSRRRY